MGGWMDEHMQCVGKRVAVGYDLTEPETGCCSPRFHGLGREMLGILGSCSLPQELEATVLCSRDLPQQRGWRAALGLSCPVNPQATDGDGGGRFPHGVSGNCPIMSWRTVCAIAAWSVFKPLQLMRNPHGMIPAIWLEELGSKLQGIPS